MTTRNALDAARDTANESACRLIGFVALWPDTPPAQAALRDLDPSAVALLDDAPRAILGAMRGLVDAGKVPDVDAATLAVGFDCWCDLGCAVAVSESMMNPAVVPGSAVEVVNQLEVLNRTFEGARAIGQATRSGDTQAATEAAKRMVESLSKPADDALANLGDFETLAERPLNWCLEGLVLNGTAALLAAGGGTGKTTLATGLALSAATGHAIFPSLRPTRQGKVIFASGEDGPEITARRVREYQRRFRLDGLADALKENFLLSDVRAVFEVDAKGGMSLSPWARQFQKHVEAIRPALVVLDHARRLMGGQSGNSNEGAGEVMAWLTGLAESAGCAVLVLSHTSKNREAAGTAAAVRGASALVDEARLVLDLSRKDNGLRLKVTKSNYSEHGQEFSFRFVPGQDAACLEEITPLDIDTGSGKAALMTSITQWLEVNRRVNVGGLINGGGLAGELWAALKKEHGPTVTLRDIGAAFDALQDRDFVRIGKERGEDRKERDYYRLTNAQNAGGYDDETPF